MPRSAWITFYASLYWSWPNRIIQIRDDWKSESIVWQSFARQLHRESNTGTYFPSGAAGRPGSHRKFRRVWLNGLYPRSKVYFMSEVTPLYRGPHREARREQAALMSTSAFQSLKLVCPSVKHSHDHTTRE
jgi:hypothetical protein